MCVWFEPTTLTNKRFFLSLGKSCMSLYISKKAKKNTDIYMNNFRAAFSRGILRVCEEAVE